MPRRLPGMARKLSGKSYSQQNTKIISNLKRMGRDNYDGDMGRGERLGEGEGKTTGRIFMESTASEKRA
ncbi:hypothetical protein PV326_001326 [Microctonus aethiopoides]|nr:hypothetical protein PV326_001326 [Microctonus aethiopoides]